MVLQLQWWSWKCEDLPNSKFQVYTLRKTGFGAWKCSVPSFLLTWWKLIEDLYNCVQCVWCFAKHKVHLWPYSQYGLLSCNGQLQEFRCIAWSIHGFAVFEVSLMAMKSLRLVKMGRSLWHRKVPWVPWQRSPELLLLQNSSLENLRMVFPFPKWVQGFEESRGDHYSIIPSYISFFRL